MQDICRLFCYSLCYVLFTHPVSVFNAVDGHFHQKIPLQAVVSFSSFFSFVCHLSLQYYWFPQITFTPSMHLTKSFLYHPPSSDCVWHFSFNNMRMEYSYILLSIHCFSLSVSFISTHPLNPLHKVKNLKKHNPDCMQAQRHLVQCIK